MIDDFNQFQRHQARAESNHKGRLQVGGEGGPIQVGTPRQIGVRPARNAIRNPKGNSSSDSAQGSPL
jgi:hypothetical protein